MTVQELAIRIQHMLDDYYGDLPVNEQTGAVVCSASITQYIMEEFMLYCEEQQKP